MVSKRRISYRGRLFLTMTALLWLVMIVFTIFQYHTESLFRQHQLKEDLDLISSRIIDAYETNVPMKPFVQFLDKYYRNTELKGLRVSVFRDDTLIHAIGEPLPRMSDGYAPPELAEATMKGTGTIMLRKSTIDVDNPYYFFGMKPSEDGHLYVHTAMPYSHELMKAIDVDNTLWLKFIILMIVVTGTAWLSTRFLGKNISLLRDFANATANGDEVNPDTEFPHDELGDISRQIVNIYQEKEAAILRSEREHRIALKSTEEKARITKQLTDNINHELKTPVGVIKGYIDTILATPDMDDASRDRFLIKVQQHIDRLCTLLNDLSTITRLEGGSTSVMRESVDFHELCENVIEELDSIKLYNGIVFISDVPEGCIVEGNYSLLYAMISNLVRNADFHSKGTECGLRLIGETPRDYRFSFYDNGTGVPEEHLPHLFDRFYRIDKGRARKAGGTGLGLPIVKNTINVLGGTITVQNSPVGGLEFNFTLLKWTGENK